MFTLIVDNEEHRLLLHALLVASQVNTGLSVKDQLAIRKLLDKIKSIKDNNIPEWQKSK